MTQFAPDESVPDDIRPLVARPTSNRSLWVLAIVLAVLGGALFYALELHRQRVTAPAVTAMAEDQSNTISAPPELAIPQDWQNALPRQLPSGYGQSPYQPPFRVLSPQSTRPKAQPGPELPGALARFAPAEMPQGTTPNAWQNPTGPTPPSIPALTGRQSPEPPKLDRDNGGDDGKQRVEATRFANPSTTVPKGTVIQAVLETALDSTRAGFARAIVSRDVFSFDGTRVLIPRGSRVIGEYKSDANLGQKRVLIQWQRLTRPDGVIIDMDSPSADPLGRAGVKGAVNNHFFQRFSGAILQSALQIGSQLATDRIANNTVYIGVPGVTQGLTVAPDKIQPTITVRQGSSVSVFVARDLDFTSVQ